MSFVIALWGQTYEKNLNLASFVEKIYPKSIVFSENIHTFAKSWC